MLIYYKQSLIFVKSKHLYTNMRTWICIFQGHEYLRICTNNLGVGWDLGL